MANNNLAILYGAFVPTNNIWDVQQIYSTEVTSPEFKELLVRLYQNINNIALVLNVKDSAIYPLQEFVNGQLWFQNPSYNSSTAGDASLRQVFRIVINFGVLPVTTSKSVAHTIPITPMTTFTRIYATASDTTGNNYLPIPYASASGTDNIQIDVNATNVTITTASDRSNFNICYCILEYIQS